MTLLALDVGNTRLKWALYDAPCVGARLLAHGAQFLENIEKLSEGEWSALAQPRWVLGCVVAGDAVRRRVEQQLELWDVNPQWVVMVGTAVTVEAIDAEGRFLGGIILPGHGIMLRALESGTAGLHVPTGEVRNFPTNTSDALTSGGTFAIAGAVQRMVDNLRQHTGQEPDCIMTGGAGWKMAPSMSSRFELVEGLIFDGLLEIAGRRFPT